MKKIDVVVLSHSGNFDQVLLVALKSQLIFRKYIDEDILDLNPRETTRFYNFGQPLTPRHLDIRSKVSAPHSSRS